MPGLPIAATSTSASRVTAASSRVREWQTVTVASACISSSAIGLPTISLRPSTTARRPASSTPLRASSCITPAGVQGTKRARFCSSRPTFTGWKPSTSFSGRTASSTRCASTCAGSGSCTRMPWISGRRFRLSTAASTCLGRGARRKPLRLVQQPQLLAAAGLAPHVDRRGRVVAHEQRAEARAARPRAASAASSPRELRLDLPAPPASRRAAARSCGRCYCASRGRGPRPLRDRHERGPERQRARRAPAAAPGAAARASAR